MIRHPSHVPTTLPLIYAFRQLMKFQSCQSDQLSTFIIQLSITEHPLLETQLKGLFLPLTTPMSTVLS